MDRQESLNGELHAGSAAPARHSRNGPWVVPLIALAGFTLANMDSSFFINTYESIRQDLGLSDTAIGLIYTISYGTGAVLSLGIGFLADHIGRKRTFQIAMTGVALGSLLTGVVWALIPLIVFRSLSQASASSEPLIGQAFVTEEVPAKRRGLWMAFQQGGYPLGYLIGSAVTAILVSLIGWRGLFFLGFIPIVLVFFITRYLSDPDRFVRAATMRDDGARSLALRKLFWPGVRRTTISMAIYAFFITVGLGSVQLWMPTLAADRGGLTVGSTAVVNTIGTAVGIAGYAFSGWLGDRIGRKPTGIIMIIPGLAFAALLATVGTSFASITVWYALWWFAYMGQYSSSMALAAESFPTESRGTGLGLVTFFVWAGAAVSGELQPVLAGHIGITAAYLILGVACPVASLAGLAVVRHRPPGQELVDVLETPGNRMPTIDHLGTGAA